MGGVIVKPDVVRGGLADGCGTPHDVKLGCPHDDMEDIKSDSMLESKDVNGDPIPVLMLWSLALTPEIRLRSPNALLGSNRGALLLSLFAPSEVILSDLVTEPMRNVLQTLPTSESRSLPISDSTPSSMDEVMT